MAVLYGFYLQGDQLTGNKAVYPNPNNNRTYSYTYNSNGQLISSTLCQSADCSKPGTISYTYNGNNVSVETSSTGGNFSITDKSEYTYDNKLTPYANTNKYLKVMMGRAMKLSETTILQIKTVFRTMMAAGSQVKPPSTPCNNIMRDYRFRLQESAAMETFPCSIITNILLLNKFPIQLSNFGSFF
ncbi:DUF4595 domain-containing protein [Chryseobacterium arthrosphaerae]|uniref:DUF4595 domain-containing protein n=1 Tax=Chryseobacterium arthrosphaerae TaxID=651561 RepID=A0A432DYY9_9FLAO|nr:DUF4595 domain-containing protein [Chryseobacterium arthrosphaerae]